MYVIFVLVLASELFALFDGIPFNSVSGMLSYRLERLWPEYKSAFSIGVFLLVTGILFAWGYGPMTSHAGLERQVQVLKIQVHELELDKVQKDSKIVLLQHEIDELERHRERLVTDVVAYTRLHSLTGAPSKIQTNR